MSQLIGTKVRQVCPNNQLSYERFKELLITLEQYGFPQLRDTPTGIRIFELLTVVLHDSEKWREHQSRTSSRLHRQSCAKH